jgi:hypothetical protein
MINSRANEYGRYVKYMGQITNPYILVANPEKKPPLRCPM